MVSPKVLLTFVAVLCQTTQVGAQPDRCGELATLLHKLKVEHQEVPVAAGVSDVGLLVTVTSAIGPEKDGWTIIFTPPEGNSCAVMIGTGWHSRPVGDGL